MEGKFNSHKPIHCDDDQTLDGNEYGDIAQKWSHLIYYICENTIGDGPGM